MELLMLCLNTFNEVQKRKKPSALRTSKSCIACSPCWPEYLAFWQAIRVNSPFFTKSSSAAYTFYLNYVSSGIGSKPNWVLRALIEPASVPCVWGSQNCKNQITRLVKLGRKDYRTTLKRLMRYCTTRSYLLFQKPSEQSSSVDIMTTRLQDILALTIQEN